MSMSQGCPTGNGEIRGPEAAQGPGSPLPGSRPERAAQNNARNRGDLDWAPPVVADQDGFGTEDMECGGFYMGSGYRPVSDDIAMAPDLASMGDGGEPFGGA